VYVSIAPPQRTKMGPQHRLEIYVSFDYPSIIRYLEPLTGDIFKAHFEDYHFDENLLPSLGKEKSLPEARQEITWNNSTLSHFDPRTNECELEVQRIINLQSIANQLPDAFTYNKKIVKSHIPAGNTPTKIEIPVGRGVNLVWFSSFWPKPEIGTRVPRFLVLGNWNREPGPGYWPIPVCTWSGNRFFKKID
jgi:hypothetical protein